MRYPNQIRQRRQIDALTGIKSSLDHLRSVIALVYLLYVANGRKSFVKYCISNGDKIKIDPILLSSIEKVMGKDNLEDIVNNNPLLTKQYEPLYVGITLLMKLAHLKMEGKQSTAERTGGIRYPKQLYFANNTIVLDLILNGFSDNVRYESLFEWLQNKKSSNQDFEDRVCMFLTTCTIFTQFKLRDKTDKELFFQTEGIYSAIKESDDEVLYADNHEFVGPTRIYNNVLGEELEPWVDINRSVLGFRNRTNPDAESMSNMISTTLNIFSVKNDATVIDNDIDEEDLAEAQDNKLDSNSLQQIFYGAPGTGKSHRIKNNARVKEADEKNLVFRTTFHPDSDYSTFVGAYKPTMKPVADKYKAVAGKDEEITYEFIPQAFLLAYIAAWNKQDENVFLVIEEINRGNCAQIFGDLFQLLDRDDDGYSEYPIKADRDLAKYLDGKDEKGDDILVNKDGIKDGKLKLPKNLYIWATMNTSDQSLFPIDSAFKRRWDWEYMPIGYKNNNWTIKIGEKEYNWVDFQHQINERIYNVDNSEDKQLGDYFVNADRSDNKISSITLLNKILFYIWNDVCKDDPDQIFRWKDDKDSNKEKSIKFSDFFCDENERNRKLQGFMSFLEVKAIDDNDESKNPDGNETIVNNNNDVIS